MVDAMSEISQGRRCGKATMYVITEKGLEMGPFMYGKNTASRVLWSNKGHIYYSQRKDGLCGTTDTRDLEEKRRLRIVDVGNSLLLSENSVFERSQFGRMAFRDVKNCGLAVGKFRTTCARWRSGKVRVNNDQDKREESTMHLGLLKQVLDRTCLTIMEGKISENNDNDEYDNIIETEENKQPVMRSRQMELKELQMKRKSKDLLEELARWKERCSLVAGNYGEVQQETEMEKKDRKRFFPNVMKTASERNVVLPRLNLTSSPSKRITNMNITDYSKNKRRNKTTASNEKTSPRITSQAADSKLIFLNPSSIFSQVKAENTAKLKINECRATCESGKPKVRFPSVIDQRTGVMHSVPGVVTYRPCDYNRWSRRNNMVRRSVVHSRSPLITYVSIFPSIPEK